MSDMADKQIVQEFKRQVRLCSGIGQEAMLEIVYAQYSEGRKHKWSFYMNGSFCERCSAQLGSPYTPEECAI